MADRLSRDEIEAARETLRRLTGRSVDGCDCSDCVGLRTLYAACDAYDAYEAQVDLLREVARGGVELDDPRVPYVTVQIDRETWQAIQECDDG